ncbi:MULTISPECIES: UDP-N-acetylglucosamine 2-epimerase [Desulfovibrio]|uniref:UDP-N-acetylglucosamine 2-epimerase n=1 Tax=Desulfovibrio TaxID=872 RepID=UPI0026F12B6A|nr:MULTISPECIES: UDP-N-acetylglucosamine 2-epimerase [Desulfovibrio]MCI7615892.1 UDP-N-acetylglucosamine 2-epimerase [Desulfovibrio piger]MDY4806857.1 UDP-N-acetylglucosamine 2-epimerase [Desulfovibrio sp.]
MSMRVLVFAGSRSQLLQHIPVERTVRSFRAWEPRLVLSSERGDHALWAPLLDDYGITPCHRLGPAPASLSDASLLAHIMGSASLLLHREAPAAVLVYGHSVTTLAAALAAAEHGIPVIHVGAGQCPKDMSSPEGRHAELTDRLSTLLCCLDPADEQDLHARQMERGTCVTGDTLYDLFEQDRPRLQPFEEAERHGAAFGEFILCYLSRPAALRSPDGIRSLLEGLQALHARQERPVLLVQHPSALACFQEREQQIPDGIRILPPLTHIAFLSLVCASTFVVTDSPALQREALYAGKRALLLPPVPSGSAAVQNGWHIACASAADLAAAGETVLQPCPHPGLPGTSGQASRRVAAAVMAILADIADGIPQGDSASGPQDD